MYYKVHLIIMLIYLSKCKCKWSLIWYDEFDGNQLDHNKWSVTDGQDILEAPENEEVLSYSRDTKETVQLVNGFLAITAIQKEYQGRKFTTASIQSKFSFKYGRVDIRTSLPMGDLLKSVILLLSKENEYGKREAGEIEIVADVKLGDYFTRVGYTKFDAQQKYPAHNDFQVYSLEWNQTSIIWRLNGDKIRDFDLDRILDEDMYQKKGQPFDQLFYLSIRLQVFRFTQDHVLINESYHDNWSCPSILIDYVRIYQEQDNLNDLNEHVLKNSDKSKYFVCKELDKKLIEFYNPTHFNPFSLIWKIGVPIFILILISLVILVFVILKRRDKQNENAPDVRSENKNYPELYDEIGRVDSSDYDLVNQRNTNNYETNQAHSDQCNQQGNAVCMQLYQEMIAL